MMTVTHEQIIEAQLETANSALDMLERVAAVGELIQFSLRQSSNELLSSGEAIIGLIDMFAEVSDFCKEIVSFDSLEGVKAGLSERPAANRPRTKEDKGK